MNNNDVLRRIRYIFDFGDSKMIALFALGGVEATRAEVSDWLKQDEDPAFKECSDELLASFLNGLITEKRGQKEGPMPAPEKRLTNNIVLRKLKIAFNLRSEDILQIVAGGGFAISKHELSSFFRRANHRNYQVCNDQILRNFLRGCELKYRERAV